MNEDKLDDVLNIAKENNKLLKQNRFFRRIKVIFIILVLISTSSYSYYLFQRYGGQIILIQDKVIQIKDNFLNIVESVENTRTNINTLQQNISR